MRVLEKDPQSVDAWTKRGNILVASANPNRRSRATSKALAIKPDHTEALNNRGCLLGEIGRTEERSPIMIVCIEINPQPCRGLDQSRPHAGRTASRGRSASRAIGRRTCSRRIIPTRCTTRASIELRLGDFKCGWENYELRWFIKDYAHTQRKYPLPRWNGEPIDGPLLVSGEQGLGDQILFASMLPDLAARVREVTVEVEPRLVPLFARSFPGVNVVAREAAAL